MRSTPKTHRQIESARAQARKNFKTHGLSQHAHYEVCRGVQRQSGLISMRLCPEWSGKANLPRFIIEVEQEIGLRPSRLMILSPIDPEPGFQPGNIRWAYDPTRSMKVGDGFLPSFFECLCPVDGHRSCPCDDAEALRMSDLFAVEGDDDVAPDSW